MPCPAIPWSPKSANKMSYVWPSVIWAGTLPGRDTQSIHRAIGGSRVLKKHKAQDREAGVRGLHGASGRLYPLLPSHKSGDILWQMKSWQRSGFYKLGLNHSFERLMCRCLEQYLALSKPHKCWMNQLIRIFYWIWNPLEMLQEISMLKLSTLSYNSWNCWTIEEYFFLLCSKIWKMVFIVVILKTNCSV